MTDLGKYKLHEQLGKGGFGTVYRATDTTLGREVVLKVLHPQLMVDENFIERFKKEARTLASLEHSNIVTIYDFDEKDGRVFIAMRYLPGGSLKLRLEKDGPIPFPEALEIMKQVCSGLQAAHEQGLVHRDIKPANILFDKSGQAVISDFGLARALQISGATSSDGFGGTPAYRAPEIWRGEPPANMATDVYSLACVLGEMLTGKALFDGKTPDEILTRHLVDGPSLPDNWLDRVPENAARVIHRALGKDPSGRQKDAKEFLSDLITRGGKSQRTEGKQVIQMSIDLGSGVRMEFIRIPAGEFLMGSDPNVDKQSKPFEQPQHTVFLDEYWIGKYPVTNQEYQVFVQTAAVQPPEGWNGTRPPEGKERHPVVYVSWEDARGFCDWLSKMAGIDVHLPGEAKWEKAARGTDGRIYPWGNQTPDSNLANSNRNICVTTVVGSYPMGASPYGALDMAGNVWEWTADWIDVYPGGDPRVSKKFGTIVRALRGGSWDSDSHCIRTTYRLGGLPSFAANHGGFRCALTLP